MGHVRTAGELLDLAAEVEELCSQAVVLTRRGCVLDEPRGSRDLAREPGLPPSERQAARPVGLARGEPSRGLIGG
jgi:hypothetical protein